MYVCVIGGANIDIVSSANNDNSDKDSHIGTVCFSFGGVARNIAENLARLFVPTVLITALANDILGKQLREDACNVGIDCSSILIVEDAKTSCYSAFLDSNQDLRYAVADTGILEHITPCFIDTKRKIIEKATICVLDTNLPQETLQYIVHTIKGPMYVLDTVSGSKSQKIKNIVGAMSLIKTNRLELSSFTKDRKNHADIYTKDDETLSEKNLHALQSMGRSLLEEGLEILVVSLGKQGVWYMEAQKTGEYVHTHIMPPSSLMDSIRIKNTTGAGDSMCAGIVYALYNKYSVYKAVKLGLVASIITVQDGRAVSPLLTLQLLEKILEDI